ncbi:molybdenum ABC transporter ATP-binding protein [Roseinatronobacter alkalisoli]|uniref:Molybdenum ABC transporter ATP-binding protein n=1 Tax=Roseinatronobacter alkalisoli TaxID=3028235 RepID=A0ABT5T8I0_9RHOB|nr:molybdenum ABC transporter ATP-binding protein [Roseinatronobacter sp. HJB301]MDD7970666.1 molybdenum ABC transporter ATP-binding protein [Roseinatronobacter sp. HJB301]
MMALDVMAKAATPIPLDVSFRVNPGELLALVGHSGSGKTTLLRTIAGLWRPDVARVRVNGTTWLDTDARVNLAPHRRRVGLVFQNYALFPHMTAMQNVMAAMDQPDRHEAARILDLVNMHGLAGRRPAQLSGGQQQRVAVARALARQPQALLLDEPFSAVDRETRTKLYSEIIALRAHLKMPVVLVTHDVNEAQLLADRMVVIEKGQVVHSGTTAQVMADAGALRALGIRDVAAMLPATIREQLADGLTELDAATGPLYLPMIDGPPGMRVQVRIMAHDVILSRARPEGLSAQNILAGHVAQIVPGAGPGVMVHVMVGPHEILARISRRAADQMALQPGDPVHAILKTMSVARDHIAPAQVTQQTAPRA